MIAAVQIVLQSSGCDNESAALLRSLLLLRATLIEKVLEDAETDFGLVHARRCGLDGYHMLVHILKAFEHLPIGTFVNDHVDHVGTIERDLLPADQRLWIHARPVVLQHLAAAIPQRRMPYSAAELTTPRDRKSVV